MSISWKVSGIGQWHWHTLDDLAYTDSGVEVAAADGRVEPEALSADLLASLLCLYANILLALLVWRILIEQSTSVLHGDVVTSLGIGLAVTVLELLLSDTHVGS